MDQNVKLLKEVSLLMPNQGISTMSFAQLYPTGCDVIIEQVLLWYIASVRVLIGEKERVIKEKQWVVDEKERIMKDKQHVIDEKERIIQEKERVIDEKERIIEANERIIMAKDDLISGLKESSDVAKALKDAVQKPRTIQKWGTVTRSQAWDKLAKDGLADTPCMMEEQNHERKNQLVQYFNNIDPGLWKEENDMYGDIINAIRDGLYEGKEGVFVVDTHSKGAFHADISVAHHLDERLPYSLRYFIELKMPNSKLDTAENCGQILDYFNAIHERQPTRADFVAILSNFDKSLVFVASYKNANPVKIDQLWATSIADAVIFAEKSHKSHPTRSIPGLDGRFGSGYTILSESPHHFLLSVPIPKPSKETSKTVLLNRGCVTRSQVKRVEPLGDDSWNSPSRHFGANGRFVMKVAHGGQSLANEISVLKKLQSANCPHLPEIVWCPQGDKELGILPFGTPIDFREPQTTSRLIVQHLISGLEFLHGLGIVHRDIRPSNLILDYTKATVNVVIIDYETAFFIDRPHDVVKYQGGFVAWPLRLLKNEILSYKPEPEDDLFASILLVLHMLFPLYFDSFRASRVDVVRGGAHSPETADLMRLWDDIGKSCIWEPFMRAAVEKDYEKLKGMADVFCHV